MSWKTQRAKYAAFRCPGSEGDPLRHHSRITEGLDMRWCHADTDREKKEREMSEWKMEQD